VDCSIIDDMLLADVGVHYSRRCAIARVDHALRIRKEAAVVADISLKNGPSRSHQFVRERDDDHVRMGPRFEIREPPSQAVRPLTMMTTDGAGPMNEQASKIRITAFADAAKRGLAACGMLPRHQPQPGGEISPFREGRRIADGGHEGCGRERADPGHLHEAFAGRVLTRERADLLIRLVNVIV
jgi:hypothetical protein